MEIAKKTAFVSTLFFLLVIGPACLLWAGKADRPADKVALVNGSIITRADYDRELKRAKQVYGMGRPMGADMLSEVKKKALENLIERELLYQESQKREVKVDPAALGQQLDGLKKRFPNEEDFLKSLNKMGLTEASLKSEFRRALAVQQLIEDEIVQKVTVPEKDVQAYYDKNQKLFKQPERVRASHILISVDSKASKAKKAEAREKIDKIQAKLKKGEDFSALAKEFSQCPSSAKGGDLGYFAKGQMVKPFEEAAFALKPGEVSNVVETRFGYHLIKLVDKKPAATLSYQDAKGRIEQQIKRQKVNDEVGQYVAQLKDKAKIERFLPTDRAQKPAPGKK